MFTANAIRNICLLGHSGSGKTALAESLLYMTGAIDRSVKSPAFLEYAVEQRVVLAAVYVEPLVVRAHHGPQS